ncbi:glycosyltransferase family 4 protein [Antarcticibacterium flavum]|uniref:Glycosyltransferase family 4 protein n=1 Tax=Antarcticibacterium flavum TaxID=2058175 RepID=A0A5B7X690_9FLAO|nr:MULTISPECIES: glycosyltransferase family 4 protein [Antarcticibacterium]MCM4161380.1 glycosyl transferase family 1 [Antarcticibacterium sp. W02-3]QCY70595.1 glycosyltransferase family 4 protein [Antarcticibacterium flavum]
MGKTVLYIGNRLSSSNTNPTTHTTLEEGLKAEGFEVISASPLKNKLLRLSHMLLVFFRNFRKANYVLIDVYSTQNFWYAVLLARLSAAFSKKYIPILHGGDLKKRFQQSPKPSAKLLKRAYCIVSPSEYLKAEVEALGYTSVKYIPNPLFLAKYDFQQRTSFQPKLLWVRAFDEIYNPLLALKTLEILRHQHPSAELCMVGPDKDGSMGKCRKYASEKDLQVDFHGKLKKKKWTRLAASYDIFLNTSNIDNTPVSVIEAMALGLPVVSTNIGGLPYLIENGVDGLLVPPNDPTAMEAKVSALLEDPAAAKTMAAAGRKKSTQFDWELIKGQWHEVLS